MKLQIWFCINDWKCTTSSMKVCYLTANLWFFWVNLPETLWFFISITCSLPASLEAKHTIFNLTSVRNLLLLGEFGCAFRKLVLSVEQTFTIFQPHGPEWDTGSYFVMTGPGQKRLFFLALGRGLGTGWADRLSNGAVTGGLGGDVQGDGVCGSGDKHQWESERHDGNLFTGSQAIPLQRKPQERSWPCAAALFEAGLSSDALQTGRLSHTLHLACLNTKTKELTCRNGKQSPFETLWL